MSSSADTAITGPPRLPNEVVFNVLAYYFKGESMRAFNDFDFVCCGPSSKPWEPLTPTVYRVCSGWRKELICNPNLYWDSSQRVLVRNHASCYSWLHYGRDCLGDPGRQLKRLRNRLEWTRTIPISIEIFVYGWEPKEIDRLQEKLVQMFKEVKPIYRGICESIHNGGIFYRLLSDMDTNHLENITFLGLQEPHNQSLDLAYWDRKLLFPKLCSFLLVYRNMDPTRALEQLECPNLNSLVLHTPSASRALTEEQLIGILSLFPKLEHIGFPVGIEDSEREQGDEFIQASSIRNLTLSSITDSPMGFQLALDFFPNIMKVTSQDCLNIHDTISHMIWGNIHSLHIVSPEVGDYVTEDEWRVVANGTPQLGELVLGGFEPEPTTTHCHDGQPASDGWFVRGWGMAGFCARSLHQVFKLFPMLSEDGTLAYWPGLRHLALRVIIYPQAFINLYRGFYLRSPPILQRASPGLLISCQNVSVEYAEKEHPFSLEDVKEISFGEFEIATLVKWNRPVGIVRNDPRDGLEHLMHVTPGTAMGRLIARDDLKYGLDGVQD